MPSCSSLLFPLRVCRHTRNRVRAGLLSWSALPLPFPSGAAEAGRRGTPRAGERPAAESRLLFRACGGAVCAPPLLAPLCACGCPSACVAAAEEEVDVPVDFSCADAADR
ncbi:uncharacterized protein Tco025E_07976 [Trypanosoma conorhini]|uniref:Uncharacterized protein n=1 Tax=Trypanosoma conorhini TaxID=83891 RepID=A0A422NGB3_9TRYP|nr:uncharacterized protein Tco025E_07976 [Trypanosoma conorhini]RNF04498.1 hypothetical protein Tco025E_07976 [Trypanosoma conorhini]